MKIGKNEKKVLILGGVALFFILSYLLYDWFIGYRNGLILKKDANKLQIIHLTRMISEKGETEKRIIDVKRGLEEIEKRLIPGDKPAVGAAELQKILKGISSSVKIEMRSEKVFSPIDMDTYTAISVEVSFMSTTASLRDFLYKIETSPFLLVIPDMKIRVTNIKNPTDIHVNLTVRGMIKRSDVEKKVGI